MKTQFWMSKWFVLILATVLIGFGTQGTSYGAPGGICAVGDVLSPGQSCTDPGTGDDFSVRGNGFGTYSFVMAGTGITVGNFSASKRGDGNWEIKSVTEGGGQQTDIDKEQDLVVTSVRLFDITAPPDATALERFEYLIGVSDATISPGESFTLSAAVRNKGDGRSSSTTLRYYRSTDSNISASDTEVGTDFVKTLTADRPSNEIISLTAPTSPGTYYYGACVDSITDESDTANNCSVAVSVTVTAPPVVSEDVNAEAVPPTPDLVIEAVQAQPTTVAPGETFRLYAILKNNGTGESTATTLRYYRSTDAVISTEDTQLRSANRDSLAANATIRSYLTVTAPTTPGTYYYGACVDSVTDESDTANNCSMAVSVTVTAPPVVSADVNDDGVVDVQDLVFVAHRYGQTGTTTADVNGDGVVNSDDLILVAAVLNPDTAAAPSLHSDALAQLTVADVKLWLSQARQRSLTDPSVQRGVLFLEQLLASLIPKETSLSANYPNPFNPETWIPYQLSKPAEVSLTIYDIHGHVVRALDLGHQTAGTYQSRSRAAFWDGRNAVGEPVASGLYFYTLTAGDFTATRKMLIRK